MNSSGKGGLEHASLSRQRQRPGRLRRAIGEVMAQFLSRQMARDAVDGRPALDDAYVYVARLRPQLTVLVDPTIPSLAEDACALLGAGVAEQMSVKAASALAAQTTAILHLVEGSSLHRVTGTKAQWTKDTSKLFVLVHRSNSSLVVIAHPNAPSPANSFIGPPILNRHEYPISDADRHQPNVWERAASLGRLYLLIGLDLPTSRLIALSVNGMDVAANCVRTHARSANANQFVGGRVDSSLLGIPCVTVAPNAVASQPYVADRAGLRISVRSSDYLSEQPLSFWPHREEASGRVLLPAAEVLEESEDLLVLDDRLIDLAVSTPMIAVRRLATGGDGYITLDALITKTEGNERDIWVAEEPTTLRRLVEFRTRAGTIYSTNRMSAEEVNDSIKFLSRFLALNEDAIEPLHPLQVGAHAHRLGVWALDERRQPHERSEVARLFSATFQRFLTPKAKEIAPGVLTWAYEFDHSMPWSIALRAPWYSGYCAAAIVGTLAVGWALTGEGCWRDMARGAVAYLKLPSHEGGAAYGIEGFHYIAEYVYRMPPIPNYRVLDGELCSPQYLHNAGLLLDDPQLVAFAHRLACGLIAPLRLLRRADGAPLYGMDGRDMDPNYMWQLWMCLQLLAAMTKDRAFAKIARDWKAFVPANFWTEGYPS
jgi:hypothetical protein